MSSLRSDGSVTLVLRLMEENGRQQQAAEMNRLLDCLDNLEQQYDAVIRELRDVKQQLAQATEKRHPVRTALATVVQALETWANQLREQLHTIREKIVSCVKNAVNGFKRAGVSALDKAVSALSIKELLESVQNKTQHSMESIKTSMKQVETIGRELRSSGTHLKNAARAAAGRDLRLADTEQGGHFQAVVLAPMKTANKMLSRMDQTAGRAIQSVERLERTAEQGRTKPSVLRRLEDKKTEIALRPTLDQVRKPPEAAR